MAESKQSSQSRFMIAIVLSMAVLLIWTYFFKPQAPATNSNTAQNSNVAIANTNTALAQPTTTVQNTAPTVAAVPDSVPNKVVTLESPLYKVKLDSRGALATSWILVKNVSSHGEKILHSDGSTKEIKKDLELIAPQAVEANPRVLPFRLVTGDDALDQLINDRNYQASVAEDKVQLNGQESKQIDFVLRDEANALEVTKSFVFRADNFVSDLSVKVLRNNQPVPNVRLVVGPSIGDQGIEHHNYYHIESEAVAYNNGGVERHAPTSIISDSKATAGNLAVNGNVDWVGVGDTYFAMAAIPSQTVGNAEFRATKYEVPVTPFHDGIIATITRQETNKETRHLLSALVPIAADGSVTKIYTGTKDYFTLQDYNKVLSDSIGRDINLVNFINFSNWTWFRPIIQPISVIIVRALSFINQFTHNYGISIVLFTLLFYSLLFPMRWYQSKSFKKAQKNAPKMKELQDKIKDLQKRNIPMDDPRMRELQMEQLKMTKDALPIGGCLPLLLQMPLLIALYTAVTISLDFRQEAFLWLPDLSKTDPFYVLPFLFAGSMYVSMLITPTTPTVTPEQQMQQKMMKYLMPAMMLWIGWSVPSGLLVYWIMGNVVSFVQQTLINKINTSGEPSDDSGVLAKNSKLSTT